MAELARPPSGATWCSPVSSDDGLAGARGVGEGDGGRGAGGCVTNVMVCAVASGCPVAVLAVDPIVTWYCVLGARLPLVGRTERVLDEADQAHVTLVAGAIWTAASVDGWSIGWLKETRIGCCRATPWLPSIELLTTRVLIPAGWVSMKTMTEAITSSPAVAPIHASPGGANARRNHDGRPSPISHACCISWRRRPERNASSTGGSGRTAAPSRSPRRRSSWSCRISSSSGS